MTHIAIRTDASDQIGMGHFMRCLVLAEELKQQGASIRFVSRNLPKYLIDILISRGLEHYSLDSFFDPTVTGGDPSLSGLQISQQQDAHATRNALADRQWDWLIVDHYALDVSWENILRKECKHLMVIDDLADRQHDCDLLLDQNLDESMQTRYLGKVTDQCKLLLGPRYALIRAEFRKLRHQRKERTRAIKKIFIFFGGVDAPNYTIAAIQALTKLDTNINVDVVVTPKHVGRESIKKICVKHGYSYYEYTNQIADLMAEADLAIGAGGTAIWERACIGLPGISFCVATNQEKQIIEAARIGLLYAPKIGENASDTILRHVQVLLENPSLLRSIAITGLETVDGRGVIRVVRELGLCAVEIRRVTKLDSKNIFMWRNHPKIRAASINNAQISLNEHQKWFDEAINDRQCDLLIGTRSQRPIGVIRFDVVGDAATVSIYVVPDKQSYGQGRNLLSAAEHWLKTNRSKIKIIQARVLGINQQSQNFFSDADYYINTIHYQKELNDRK